MAEFTWETALAIVSILGALLVLLNDWAGSDFVFLAVLSIFMATRMITVQEGLAGFSSEAPLTVAVLFVVASGISGTGCLDAIFSRILGRQRNISIALLRMLIPTVFLSGFINDTPLVAIMIPILKSWCERNNLPPRQFYIPLSFASLLGGTCTLVGTSTNLVIAGLMEEYAKDHPDSGVTRPEFFDITPYGVPVAIFGIVYIFIFSRLILGRSKTKAVKYSQSSFLVGMEVLEDSVAVGVTIEEAGLRGLDGLYLVSVRRGSSMFSAVGPEFVIAANDILYFTGVMDRLKYIADAFSLRAVTDEMEESMPALLGSPTQSMASHHSINEGELEMETIRGQRMTSEISQGPSLRQTSIKPLNRLLQAEIAENAPIIGHSVKEVGFRSRFNAAILLVSRNGEAVPGSLGRIVLEAGDVLVLDCSQEFDEHSEEATKNMTNIMKSSAKSEREFMVSMEVSHKCSLVGKSIDQAGLRGLPQLFLVEIERKTGHRIPVVPPTEILQAGDVLWFSGVLESVTYLRKIPGLVFHKDQVKKLKLSGQERRLVEAVISPTSVLVGKTVRESRFRTIFHAAIIGVHRQGRLLKVKIGDIVLRGGDVLLLDTDKHFIEKYKNSRHFALVSEVADGHHPRYDRAFLAMTALIAMVSSQMLGVVLDITIVRLIVAALLAAGIMLLGKCISGDQARASVRWDIIITVAASFGVSKAMEKSNVAQFVADGLVSVGEAIGGDFFVMAAVYIATMLLSNVITNNAVAALMCPVAIRVALERNISTKKMGVLLMLASSSAFMSPFGYQTNLMVFAVGGYTVMDFIKFGAPMQIWQTAISLAAVALDDYFVVFLPMSFVVASSIFVLQIVFEKISEKRSQALSHVSSTLQQTNNLVSASAATVQK